MMDEVAYPPNAWEADGLDYGNRVALLMASADGMKLWQFALQMTKLAGDMARVLDGDLTTEDPPCPPASGGEQAPGPPVVAPRAIAGGTVQENGGLESPLSIGEDGMDPQVDTPPAPPQAGGSEYIPERKVMLEALGAFCEANGLVKVEVSKAIKTNFGVARFEDLTDRQIFLALGTLGVSVDDIPI